MKSNFTERNIHYNMRNESHLQLPNVRTPTYGIENIPYIGHHLWSPLPKEIKDSKTLPKFKQIIKSWNGHTCICGLCKMFNKDLGYL